MRVENGTVILEKKDCYCSKHGRIPGVVVDKYAPKQCPKCKGTGKRGNGRCRNCNNRDVYYSDTFPRTPGSVPDYDNYTTKVCPRCNGNWQNALDENLTDNLPIEICRSIPVEVFKKPTREITFNEAHLGFGTVYSVVDYGRSRDWSDEQYIEAIHESMNIQVCNYVRKDDMKLCDCIDILTSNQGFSAWPVWKETK
jgi:hypothetical protein